MTERRQPREYGPQQMAYPAHTSRRVVTMPEADPAAAWNTFAQRQERMRRERDAFAAAYLCKNGPTYLRANRNAGQ